MDLGGANYKMVTRELTNAVALDFDYASDRIYWSEVTHQNSTISRMFLNGTGKEVGRPHVYSLVVLHNHNIVDITVAVASGAVDMLGKKK